METKISTLEEKKKKKNTKNIEEKDAKKIIIEDGTLSSFGFNDNYNSSNNE